MKWNKSEYGNIEDIRMPPSKLWKPDVLMYNRLVKLAHVAVNSRESPLFVIDDD